MHQLKFTTLKIKQLIMEEKNICTYMIIYIILYEPIPNDDTLYVQSY